LPKGKVFREGVLVLKNIPDCAVRSTVPGAAMDCRAWCKYERAALPVTERAVNLSGCSAGMDRQVKITEYCYRRKGMASRRIFGGLHHFFQFCGGKRKKCWKTANGWRQALHREQAWSACCCCRGGGFAWRIILEGLCFLQGRLERIFILMTNSRANVER